MARAKKVVVKKTNWVWLIVFLILLLLVGLIFTSCIAILSGGQVETPSGNVALIKVHGIIMSTGDSSLFGQEIASADSIIKLIEKADRNPNIKAIIFEINSPGGSAVATEEIVNAIKKTNKTTVSYIREVGASGGYWTATATEQIYASRMSITGSIGVLASYLEFSGLLEDYNITYQRMVGGRYKDVGSPFKKMTPIEERMFQEQIDQMHDFFIKEVAENRGMPEAEVRALATGMFYIGAKAKQLGLIDEIGGREEAIAYIEEKLDIKANVAEYRREPTILDILAGIMNKNSFFVGQGIASYLTKTPQTQMVNVWA